MSSDKSLGEEGEIIEVLLKLGGLVEVTGQTKGKIEMKVSLADLPAVLSLLQKIDVDRGLRLIPGLEGYEVSTWFRSATISYDPSVFPSDLWDDFRGIRRDGAKENVVRNRLYALVHNGRDREAVGK